MELRKERIILTGAAGGIGSEITKKLLEAGSIVAAVDIDEEGLKKLVKYVSNNKKSILEVYNADVSRFSDVKQTVDDFYGKYGEIDILINNAAILCDSLLINVFGGKIIKHKIENWEKTINTNLSSYFFFAREVVEKMVLERTKGVIINVSSISSSGNLGQTSYSASKAAVNALTVTWSQELTKFGIRVAGVSPGMTDTFMPRNSMKDIVLEDWVRKTPLRRMAFPEEIAKGVLFLLENDFICGRTIQIDGGLRM